MSARDLASSSLSGSVLLAMTEHRLLRKAAHMHRPFDRLPFAAELQAPFGRAHDGHEAEIEVGRVRPIELHLADGRGVAREQRREIDEAQVHALPDLVGLVARQEYARDVGLDDVDARHRRTVRGGRAHQRHDRALLVVGWRSGRDRHEMALVAVLCGRNNASQDVARASTARPISIRARRAQPPRRENSVCPPVARMRACSIQFSRSMRPLKSRSRLMRSMSAPVQLAICS